MRFVVVDVFPALLSWEGRERASEPRVAPEADEAIAHLHAHYRLIAIADAGVSRAELTAALDAAGVGRFFDSITTAAGLGPEVTPRVIRRLIHGDPDGPIVVTGREELARALSRSRIGVVITDQKDFGAVPEAVASLLAGRVSP